MYRDVIMILLLVLFPQGSCKNWTGCLPSKHARIDTDFLEKLKVLSHPSRSLFLWFCPKDQWLSCYMLTYVNITLNTCICLCCNMYLFNPIYILSTLVDQRDSMLNDLTKSFFGQDLPSMASGPGPPRGVSCFSRSLVRYARKTSPKIEAYSKAMNT